MTDAMLEPGPTIHHRRWFRFSLRSLLVSTVLMGLLMGWIAKERMQSQRQRNMAKSLEEQGWSVGFGEHGDRFDMRSRWGGEEWWSRLARQTLGKRVVYLEAPKTTTDLSVLVEFKDLEWLGAGQTQVSDLAPVAGLTHLQHLDLSQTRISDLSPLAKLTQLETLDLNGTPIRDLTPLSGLKDLRALDVSYTQVSNLQPLLELGQLTFLSVHDTQVTREAGNAAQHALPGCKVLRNSRKR